MRTLAALCALLAAPDALACGGFFCMNQAQPVDQAGERILFAVDEAKAQIEVQVQITYQGTAEGFAWILPTPTQPEVATTVDDVFSVLGTYTFPLWQLNTQQRGQCREDLNVARNFPMAMNDSAGAPQDADGGGSVTVAAEGQVGPYEQAVLTAESADVLVTWLRERGYLVTDAMAAQLAPYVAEGSWFVALRLTKEADAGDIVPVSITYPGTEPVIPLRLTSIAATPDMPLQPFVLAKSRAVPENYLHVEINPFAIDWVGAGANYWDVIARAADEANGQGFATDFAGPASVLDETFWAAGRYEPTRFLGHTYGGEVLGALRVAGFPVSNGTIAILDQLADPPLPAGETIAEQLAALGYLGYVSEVDLGGSTIDGDALAEVLADTWVPAMRHAQELADAADTITRLTSSISADEMTLDPLFVLNPDMPEVPRERDATLVIHCSPGVSLAKAPLSLELPDGRSMRLPDGWTTDVDRSTWLATVNPYATDRVEKTGRQGNPELIADHRPEIDAAIQAANAELGCGCSTGGGGAGGVAALLGLLALRRRR